MSIQFSPRFEFEPPDQNIHRILFIDAFDSFSNNIIGLLESDLNVHVSVIHIDDEQVSTDFEQFIRDFDAVVIGPGPGHPAIHSDVGLINKLWSLSSSDMLPVFGICLGFQSLSLAHGATVSRLAKPRHGMVTRVTHKGTDIFKPIGDVDATQYHSLRVRLDNSSSTDPSTNVPLWSPTATCPELLPLAWDLTDKVNGPILMAVRHVEKPFWGVQFHPESICTSVQGRNLLRSWWANARSWLSADIHGYMSESPVSWDHLWGKSSNPSPSITTATSGEKSDDSAAREVISVTTGTQSELETKTQKVPAQKQTPTSHVIEKLQSVIGKDRPLLRWAKFSSCQLDPAALCERLELENDEIVMLDSQSHKSGRFSIIGVIVSGKTPKITYRSHNHIMECKSGSETEYSTTLQSIDQLWPVLQESLEQFDPAKTQADRRDRSGMDHMMRDHLPEDSPFWGGFMGYISYEAGLETIDVSPHEPSASSHNPDINFAFVYRSIVFDSRTSQIYVQSLSPQDWTWILHVGGIIDSMVSHATLGRVSSSGKAALEAGLQAASIIKPPALAYRSKVLTCQDFLLSGNSYELCLTDQTQVFVPLGGRALHPWSLYKKLRRRNAAPFGAFLHLSGALVVSTSPERFLNWNRDGRCQFRPIKGTVKKTPEMTHEEAYRILNSSKEQAENLMIVDLIRHDLGGVIGSASVRVPKLMVVEEYETVYQLVSVIEGQISKQNHGGGKLLPSGLDVLKASLPPGSMTGAPKKRSCEILRDIEKRPRGIYSGVLGYLDVGGGGDFSVVIRTAIRGPIKPSVAIDTRSGANAPVCTDSWYIGAGGAVTIQSTDKGEYLEMETKVASVLQAFQST